LLHLRDAALQLGVSFPTSAVDLQEKIRSIQTAGDTTASRERSRQAALRTPAAPSKKDSQVIRRVSGHQLVAASIRSA